MARARNAATRYGHHRLCGRFDAYRAAHPDVPLAATVQTWLGLLPASQQNTARTALKHHLGRAALDWEALAIASYRRNEANLAASVLREADRARVREAARGPQERALVECLWVLRRAEAAALCWRDLDLAQGMVYVRCGKGAKAAWTLLPPATRAVLAEWFEAAGHPAPATPVFPVPPGLPVPGGHPYTPQSLGRVVQRILTRAGLWHRGAGSAHRFRRSFATQYLRANPADLVGLKTLMRHEGIATTARYTFLEPEDLAPRMAAMQL